MKEVHNMRNRRGQSVAEYGIVLGLVVAAVVGMQVYVNRSFKAKIKDSTDHAVSGIDTVTGRSTKQYEPDYTHTDYNVTQDQKNEQTVATTGITSTLKTDKTSRTGSSTTEAPQ